MIEHLFVIWISKSSMWDQIWGLPINEKMVCMSLKLGEKLGKVMEAVIFDMLGGITIVKVRVNMSKKITYYD